MDKLPHWRTPISEEDRKPHSCLHCEAAGTIRTVFGDDQVIAVGFGSATLTKNGALVYEEEEGKEWMTGKDALVRAKLEPEADWIIDLQAPLAGRTYQFQGDHFVLVDQNEGFA